MLWSLSRGIGYYPTASWGRPLSSLSSNGKLSVDHPFIAGFRDGGWIQERTAEEKAEAWSLASDKAWLAVPLSYRGEVVGFVSLDRANHTVELDWEAFDLLRATGRQAASYLAEERATKVLHDTELLTEYSKRFAFVVHDIKNLASQLNLIVSNARHYIDDPELTAELDRRCADTDLGIPWEQLRDEKLSSQD